MASAVAAPIPRLAPVTTATRPVSQCTGSPMVRRPAAGTGQPPVEPLMSVQAPFQVELPRGVLAAGRTRNPGRPPDGGHGGPDVTGRHQEAGHAVRDHLAEPSAPEADDGGSAGLRLGGGHPERFVPL